MRFLSYIAFHHYALQINVIPLFIHTNESVCDTRCNLLRTIQLEWACYGINYINIILKRDAVFEFLIYIIYTKSYNN